MSNYTFELSEPDKGGWANLRITVPNLGVIEASVHQADGALDSPAFDWLLEAPEFVLSALDEEQR